MSIDSEQDVELADVIVSPSRSKSSRMRRKALVTNSENRVAIGVEIDVSDLSYSIVLNNKHKTLLQDISFRIPKGSMCALMGPSGAGKSTLLDMLSERKQDGIMTGSVLVDRCPRTATFRRESAYVLQEDVLIALLTVEETIRYAAWTKLPESTTVEEVDNRVTMLLELMQLTHVKDSYVGDALVKGISGGQKKRLSIAVEIVSLPNLVFLDEPTSGLDSTVALEVMVVVNELSTLGRTCITTIHQPSVAIFNLFNLCLLMESGRLIYCGKPSDALEYFLSPSLGFLLPAVEENMEEDGEGNVISLVEFSLADFLISICNEKCNHVPESKPLSAIQLSNYYKSSPIGQQYQPLAMSLTTIRPQFLDRFARIHETSTWTQVMMLLHRTFTAQSRNVGYVKGSIMRSVVIGVIGGIFFQSQGKISLPFFEATDVPSSGQLGVNAMLFFLLVYVIDSNDHVIPLVCSQMNQCRRDVAAFKYTVTAYWICAVVESIPLLFLCHTILITMLYLAVQMPLTFDYYCYFHFMYFLGTLMSFYISVTTAAWTGDTGTSYAVVTNVILCVQFFAGFTVSLASLPIEWRWVSEINFARWCYQGILVNEYRFHTYTSANDDHAADGIAVLESLGFASQSKMLCMLYLVINIVVLCLLMYIGMMPSASSISLRDKLPEDGSDAGTNAVIHNIHVSLGKLSSLCRPAPKRWPARRAMAIATTTVKSSTIRASVSSSSGKDMHCELIFQGITYTIPDVSANAIGGKANNTANHISNDTNTKALLSDVSGHVLPGDLCALMGPSGAGKTTLMDVLAGRKTKGVSGQILYNGKTKARSVAYVMQDNVHISCLTVKESLMYAAHLRINGLSTLIKERQVSKVMAMLGLTAVENSPVGNENSKSLSGGEMRRLSIGVEIIHLPDLIFLDEPTTGLDSWSAMETMSAVRNLANDSLTVMCTIHQPSTAIYEMFTTLMILCGGCVVYFGPANAAVSYFTNTLAEANINDISMTGNPADFIMNVCQAMVDADNSANSDAIDNPLQASTIDQSTAVSSGNAIEHLTQLYRQSSQFKRLHDEISPVVVAAVIDHASLKHKRNAEPDVRYHVSTLMQVYTLCHRMWRKNLREPSSLISYFVRHLIIGIFYGSLYYDLGGGTEVSNYTNRLALIFYSVMFAVFSNIQHVPLVFESRLIFYRERAAHAYGAFPHFISMFIVSVPAAFVNVLVFSSIIYKMTGLSNAPGCFEVFFITLFICSVTGQSMCHFLANNCSTPQATLTVLPIFIFLSVMLAGYIVLIPNYPIFIKAWAPWFSFMRWSFQALVLNEFNNNPLLPYGPSYVENFEFSYPSKFACMGILFLFTFTFMCGTLYSLKFKNFEKR